ncbi:MAG: hypothetical protein ACRECY_04120 [Phyllobacterium sp.]
MIIRQAFFDGSIRQGCSGQFRTYVAERLLPLWRRFPGVREVRVLHGVARDDGAPDYAMVLSMAFDSEAALADALDSSVRYESREVTKGLMAMFEGHIHHHVFAVAQG